MSSHAGPTTADLQDGGKGAKLRAFGPPMGRRRAPETHGRSAAPPPLLAQLMHQKLELRLFRAFSLGGGAHQNKRANFVAIWRPRLAARAARPLDFTFSSSCPPRSALANETSRFPVSRRVKRHFNHERIVQLRELIDSGLHGMNFPCRPSAYHRRSSPEALNSVSKPPPPGSSFGYFCVRAVSGDLRD